MIFLAGSWINGLNGCRMAARKDALLINVYARTTSLTLVSTSHYLLDDSCNILHLCVVKHGKQTKIINQLNKNYHEKDNVSTGGNDHAERITAICR